MPIINWGKLVFFSLLTSIFVFAWLIQSTVLAGPDISWLITVSQRLLNGGTYTDNFFEPNPPLIFYLYMLPVIVMKLFSLSSIISFRLCVLLLIIGSFYLCDQLSRMLFKNQNKLFFYFFMVAILATFLILPINEFGQREHLLIILIMPYLLAIAYRLEGNSIPLVWAIPIGLLAGIGFSIKPYFLITFVLTELCYALNKGKLFAWLRSETLIILGFITLYIIAIFVFFPDYIKVIIPYANYLYYAGYGNSLSNVLLNPTFLFCVIVTGSYIAVPQKRSKNTISTILFVASIGLALSYLAQRKIAYYYFLPMLSVSLLQLVIYFCLALFQENEKRRNISRLLLLSIVMLFFLYYFNHMPWWTILILEPAAFYSYFAVLFYILLALAFKKNNFIKSLIAISIIISINYWVIFLMINLGWYTHQFEMSILLLFLLFYLFIPQPFSYKCQYITMAACACIIFAYPVQFVSDRYYTFMDFQQWYGKDNLHDFLRGHAQHRSVYFFSTTSYLIDYNLSDKITSASRFSFFWMLPGLLVKNQPTPYNDFFIDMVASDLEKNKPDYVIIDMRDNKFHLREGMKLDYLSYFLKNKHFQFAWKSYRYLTQTQGTSLYFIEPLKMQIYRRYR